MPKIVVGAAKFQRDIFPQRRALFEKLATGQTPEALFITCSDSRIDPSLMTQTDPGELFICRNAGNIVPPHTTTTGGMTASIEFAVGALGVTHVVVCGHSQCGAMKGAMDLEGLNHLPHTKEWLSYTQAAVQIVNEGEGLSADEKMHRLIRENVLLQMQHLRTHPMVAARLASQKLQLHGWVYDIPSGGIEAYDANKGAFLPIEERYRERITYHMEQLQKDGHAH
jgi:carbonic anhydrase